MDNSYLVGCKLLGMLITVNVCEAFLVGLWVRNSESPGGLLKAPPAWVGGMGSSPALTPEVGLTPYTLARLSQSSLVILAAQEGNC